MLVLHGLRVKGFAAASALAEFTGLAELQVVEHLDAMSAAGLVTHVRGRVIGWRLTTGGGAEHQAHVVSELAQSGSSAQVQAAYGRFVALDGSVKAVCTAWQLRDLDAGVVNDHSDAAYDAAVVARLTTVHGRALAVVDALTEAMSRFRPYRHRLDAAHQRVVDGDRDALTRPLSGSYHDVWMELHEDLLLTQGIERSGS